MAILDVIESFDNTGELIVLKFPQEGSGEFRLGSQLIVQENQIAVFYKDGQILDRFTSGRYTLESQNLPLLTKLLSIPYGGKSPFRSYVYFISTKTFTNLGWGTPAPVLLRDSTFRMISLRAFGAFSIRITNPILLLSTLVGTKGVETTFALEEFLRTFIVSQLTQTIGCKMKTILDLPTLYNEISLDVKNKVGDGLAQYGLQLVDLIIEAITPPPEVQQMINKATGIEAQNVDKYMSISTADAMVNLAKSSGGGGSEGMGAGIGIALGTTMMNKMTRSTETTNSGMKIDFIICDKCNTQAPLGSKFCPECADPFDLCPQCNVDNPKGSKVCRGCKKPLPVQCACGETLPSIAKFCTQCGKKMFQTCAKCNSDLDLNTKFCPTCGTKVEN